MGLQFHYKFCKATNDNPCFPSDKEATSWLGLLHYLDLQNKFLNMFKIAQDTPDSQNVFRYQKTSFRKACSCQYCLDLSGSLIIQLVTWPCPIFLSPANLSKQLIKLLNRTSLKMGPWGIFFCYQHLYSILKHSPMPVHPVFQSSDYLPIQSMKF